MSARLAWNLARFLCFTEEVFDITWKERPRGLIAVLE